MLMLPTWPVWPRETSRWPATVWRSRPRSQTAAPPRSSSARQGSPWRTMAWWQLRCDHQTTWERPTTDDDDDTVPLPEEDLVKQNLFCNFLSRWRWSHLSLISMMTGILTSLGSPLISVAKSRHPHCDYRWPGRNIFILSSKTNSYYPHYPNFVCAKNKIITIAVQASWLIGKSDNVESNRFSDSPANQQSCSNFSSVFLLSHNVNFCTVQKKEEISVDPVDICAVLWVSQQCDSRYCADTGVCLVITPLLACSTTLLLLKDQFENLVKLLSRQFKRPALHRKLAGPKETSGLNFPKGLTSSSCTLTDPVAVRDPTIRRVPLKRNPLRAHNSHLKWTRALRVALARVVLLLPIELDPPPPSHALGLLLHGLRRPGHLSRLLTGEHSLSWRAAELPAWTRRCWPHRALAGTNLGPQIAAKARSNEWQVWKVSCT